MSVALIRAALLSWYDDHRRKLPWRAAPGETPDPYRVWLSEIMLQQTTAAHAAPYFTAFTRRWPTIEALAAAEPPEIMAAWAGLGYYARARNLIACARLLADDGGVVPSTAEALRRLPGVGDYTAAAIAAIAFGQAANAVDANVRRVAARLYAVEAELPGAAGELDEMAARLVRRERAGDWPQALMDLGATVCRPLAPLCGQCPLAPYCRARASAEPQTYPRRRAKARRPRRHGVAYVLTHGGSVGMVRRPAGGLLGGMMGLPTSDWRAKAYSNDEALGAAPAPGAWRWAGAVRHVFTHFQLDLAVMTGEAAGAQPWLIWMAPAEAARAAPPLFKKALRLGL
jgi:A/G-specific adenine glycosylase